MATDTQAAQLEALRRLFSNDELLSGLLAQGMGGAGPSKKRINAEVSTGAPKSFPDTNKTKKISKQKEVSDELGRETARTRLRGKRSKFAPPPSDRVAKSHVRGVKGKTVDRNTYTSLSIDEEDESDGANYEEDPIARIHNPASNTRHISRPRKRTQNPRNQHHDVHLVDMGLDDGDEAKQFVIGLDYGTTFTSVSYYCYTASEDNPRALPSDVKSIVNWPADGMSGMRRQIPTESWYSTVPQIRVPAPDQFELGDSDDEENGMESTSVTPPKIPRVPRESERSEQDGEDSARYLWGYEVPYQRYRANTERAEIRRIERPKLMLVNTAHTKADRERLRPRLDHLIERGLIQKYGKRRVPTIQDVQDAISDFLVAVFRHTKQQLIEAEGLTDESKVSFVLTVPAIWYPKSSRVLQYAVEAAIRATGFGTLGHGSVDNLFIITEPEAAATYLLGSSHDMIVCLQTSL